MSTEPKLTAEQVQRLWEIGGYAKSEFEAELRRMGLIAPEPVDPLREALDDCWHLMTGPRGKAIDALTAELRQRGMELAQPTLTREVVREAEEWLRQCSKWLLTNDLDMNCPMQADPLDIADRLAELRLHAALTGAK